MCINVDIQKAFDAIRWDFTVMHSRHQSHLGQHFQSLFLCTHQWKIQDVRVFSVLAYSWDWTRLRIALCIFFFLEWTAKSFFKKKICLKELSKFQESSRVHIRMHVRSIRFYSSIKQKYWGGSTFKGPHARPNKPGDRIQASKQQALMFERTSSSFERIYALSQAKKHKRLRGLTFEWTSSSFEWIPSTLVAKNPRGPAFEQKSWAFELVMHMKFQLKSQAFEPTFSPVSTDIGVLFQAITLK